MSPTCLIHYIKKMEHLLLDFIQFGKYPAFRANLVRHLVVQNVDSYIWDIGHGHIFIYFLGSDSILDFGYNLDARHRRISDTDEAEVHSGFLRALNAIRPQLDMIMATICVTRLSIGGFSLGGAIALIYGYVMSQHMKNIPIEIFALATPIAIGNLYFNHALNNRKNVRVRIFVHKCDPVPFVFGLITTLIPNNEAVVYIQECNFVESYITPLTKKIDNIGQTIRTGLFYHNTHLYAAAIRRMYNRPSTLRSMALNVLMDHRRIGYFHVS
jgi:hypothetical protein